MRKSINRATARKYGISIYLHVLSKNENIINPCWQRSLIFPSLRETFVSREGTGYFLKIAKINPQLEKPMSPDRKN